MSNQADHTIIRLRVPPELKQKIEQASEENNRSQSAEMVARLEDSFLIKKDFYSQAEVKLINLRNGKKRVIYGKLLHSFDIDYTQDLASLREDIEISLNALSRSSFWKYLQFLNKDVLVYKGDNHIDVVDNGRKSLNWLVVEDHYSQKYIEDTFG